MERTHDTREHLPLDRDHLHLGLSLDLLTGVRRCAYVRTARAAQREGQMDSQSASDPWLREHYYGTACTRLHASVSLHAYMQLT